VGFAPCRDAEQLAEGACHGGRMPGNRGVVKSGFISREGR
jgi:hypothetical protein